MHQAQGGVSALAMVREAILTYITRMGGNASTEKGFQMTSLTTNTFAGSPGRLRNAMDGVMAFLVLLAEASPRYRLLQKYNALSDEQLAEMGISRADVVERVFGARVHY